MSDTDTTEGTEAEIPPTVETPEAEKPKRARKPKTDDTPPADPPADSPPKASSKTGPPPWPLEINGKLGPKEPAVQAWLADNGYEPHATLP